MNCLKHIARQMVQQTSSYSYGQTYVIPLLMSVLPAIDLNDTDKTFATLDFLETILSLITCMDCSSAVNTRNDLTEVRRQSRRSSIQNYHLDWKRSLFIHIKIRRFYHRISQSNLLHRRQSIFWHVRWSNHQHWYRYRRSNHRSKTDFDYV